MALPESLRTGPLISYSELRYDYDSKFFAELDEFFPNLNNLRLAFKRYDYGLVLKSNSLKKCSIVMDSTIKFDRYSDNKEGALVLIISNLCLNLQEVYIFYPYSVKLQVKIPLKKLEVNSDYPMIELSSYVHKLKLSRELKNLRDNLKIHDHISELSL